MLTLDLPTGGGGAGQALVERAICVQAGKGILCVVDAIAGVESLQRTK